MRIGSDPQLMERMSIESRRMAEDATWEKINNRVAWKLAEALVTEEAPREQPSFSIPVYSWLLLSPELRSFMGSLIVDFKLMGGIGIIIGVWAGLVVTWILVQAALVVRAPRTMLRSLQGGA